jgi:preprotein translocase subunit SecG
MVYLLTTIHLIVRVFLIIVVLLQSGKAADLVGAFGGMGSQTVFGPRGSARVLSKATTIAATVFMVTSLSLSIMATRGSKAAPSILDKVSKPVSQQKAAPVPVAPGGTVPITVTPTQDGVKGTPSQIQVPVVPVPRQQPPHIRDQYRT